MDVLEQLGQLIDVERDRLRSGVPPDRDAALLALLRARDTFPIHTVDTSTPDLITGWRLTDAGGNLAFRLVLGQSGGTTASTGVPAGWATQFLGECAHLAETAMVLRHIETGFMHGAMRDDGSMDVWVSTRRPPAAWRERADAAWWTSRLLDQHGLAVAETASGDYQELTRHVDGLMAAMEQQLGYPPGATIGGYSLRLAVETVRQLLLLALQREENAVWAEAEMVSVVSRATGVDLPCARETLDVLTLTRDNAAWHSAVPGIAAAPVVRIGADRLALSRYGLMTEPLLFLTRELRRRDPDTYHNAASAREGVFRDDLYAPFADKRFVTSPGRIRLRHQDGKIRTDIDAAVFDRKTGTLGIFELKSQDPYARSTAALQRQRDNLLYANRQVSGVLDWIKRHGANEILERIDSRTARTFRVQKVYPFVLGRYLARFDDGPAPDKRAAWGTWPGVLRVMEGAPIRVTDANPVASLFTRLPQDEPPLPQIDVMFRRELSIGGTRIVVHPSWAAFQVAGEE